MTSYSFSSAMSAGINVSGTYLPPYGTVSVPSASGRACWRYLRRRRHDARRDARASSRRGRLHLLGPRRVAPPISMRSSSSSSSRTRRVRHIDPPCVNRARAKAVFFVRERARACASACRVGVVGVVALPLLGGCHRVGVFIIHY